MNIENLVAYGLGEALKKARCEIIGQDDGKEMVIATLNVGELCYKRPIRNGVLRFGYLLFGGDINSAAEKAAIEAFSGISEKAIFYDSKDNVIFECPGNLVIRAEPQIDVRKDLDDFDEIARQMIAAMKGEPQNETPTESEVQEIARRPTIQICLGGVQQAQNPILPNIQPPPKSGD